jgi:hypothetical protein
MNSQFDQLPIQRIPNSTNSQFDKFPIRRTPTLTNSDITFLFRQHAVTFEFAEWNERISFFFNRQADVIKSQKQSDIKLL